MKVVPSRGIVLILGGIEQEREMGEMIFYMAGIVIIYGMADKLTRLTKLVVINNGYRKRVFVNDIVSYILGCNFPRDDHIILTFKDGMK